MHFINTVTCVFIELHGISASVTSRFKVVDQIGQECDFGQREVGVDT